VHSLRAVLGLSGVGVLRGLAVTLRLLGNVFRYTGGLLINLYDLFIFAPLWIEGALKGGSRERQSRNDVHEREEPMTIREASV